MPLMATLEKWPKRTYTTSWKIIMRNIRLKAKGLGDIILYYILKDMQMSFKQTFGPNHLNSAGLKTESGGDNVSFAKTSTIFGKGANTPFEVNKIDEEFQKLVNERSEKSK